MAFGQPIAFTQPLERFGAHGRQQVDGRAIFLVGHYAAVGRISSRGDGGPIDLGGTQKNRMVVPEADALLGKVVQSRRVPLGDEVGPHSVPDDEDDLLSFAGSECSEREQSVEKNGNNDSAHETFSVQIIPTMVK